MRGGVALVLLAGLSACVERQPIPVNLAMIECRDEARLATKPSGAIGIGVNSSGKVSPGLSLSIPGDLILGRTPQEVYARCVVNKSGVPPTEPYMQTGGMMGRS